MLLFDLLYVRYFSFFFTKNRWYMYLSKYLIVGRLWKEWKIVAPLWWGQTPWHHRPRSSFIFKTSNFAIKLYYHSVPYVQKVAKVSSSLYLSSSLEVESRCKIMLSSSPGRSRHGGIPLPRPGPSLDHVPSATQKGQVRIIRIWKITMLARFVSGLLHCLRAAELPANAEWSHV